MPYGIRHTKKTYLTPKGVKKTKHRFGQRGKKNARVHQAHAIMSAPPPESLQKAIELDHMTSK